MGNDFKLGQTIFISDGLLDRFLFTSTITAALCNLNKTMTALAQSLPISVLTMFTVFTL